MQDETGSELRQWHLSSHHAPSHLRHLESDERRWIAFETEHQDDFFSWWRETEYGRQLVARGISKIRWSSTSHHSPVWAHFDQVADSWSGRPKVMCRSCATLLDHPHYKSHGPSAMAKHRGSQYCRKGQRGIRSIARTSHTIDPNLPIMTGGVGGSRIAEQLLSTVASLQLPWSIVDTPAFRELLHVAQAESHDFEIPSSDILRCYSWERVHSWQTESLKGLPTDARASISLSSCQVGMRYFAAIVLHFLDKEWNYQELLLSFEPFIEDSAEQGLCDLLLQCLEKWGLRNRIFSVFIHDSIGGHSASLLQTMLLSNGIVKSARFIIRSPCMAQVIQNCLRKFMSRIIDITTVQVSGQLRTPRCLSFLSNLAGEQDPSAVLLKVVTRDTSIVVFFFFLTLMSVLFTDSVDSASDWQNRPTV